MAGDARYTDTRADEAERGVTIKSTGVSLYFDWDLEDGKGQQGYLINLIDSPGHVDFSSEVTAALRQALQERVRPVLMVNKVDRGILELQMDGEEMYNQFRKSVEDVNVITSMYADELIGDVQLDPSIGTVAFGSGLHQWGFTIETFARIYGKKFGVDTAKMMKRLWGESYFSAKKKVWTNKPQHEGEQLRRAFCQFIMDPICNLCKAIMAEENEKVWKMLKGVGVDDKIKGEDRNLTGKALLKKVMQTWLPAGDALMGMFVSKLPSPVVAQKYRVDNLYEGPMDDEAAK